MYALVIGALLAVFALISWQVAVSGPLLAVDVALRDAAARWTSPQGPLTSAAQVGADLGGIAAAGGALAVGAAAVAWRRRSWGPVALAAAAAVSVPLVVLPLKEAFGRLGPDGLPLGGYAGYYPSGHTLTAAMAYGTLALLCARRAPFTAPALAALLSLCTGAGLVLRGYHWVTDVLASWALAGVLLCGLYLLTRRGGVSARRPPRPVLRRGRRSSRSRTGRSPDPPPA